ncbi:hypothetical protein NLU13_4494 [Sarocladium strictum]|uniref:F-box domain-containing protein n=1 Tax=Sarocladium strictum TaxID=5046 RepID=A0AA39L8Y6_SARSR|nr:hypothetical protein NLU13_4494 [Sarocladium strictum]
MSVQVLHIRQPLSLTPPLRNGPWYRTKCILPYRSRSTMDIQAIPIEIALHIALHLDPEDLFHWALTCRQFEYLIRDNAVCRASLRTWPFSRECLRATESFHYAKGLRTQVKRRRAIQTAQPFSVAILEGGDAFVYANGSLCYTFGQNQVRLLNFNEPQVGDWSFDIRQLLRSRLPQLRKAHKHKCRPLHFDDGLFSCLYSSKTDSFASPLHWLIVVNVEERSILTVCELDRIDDLWVRNTREWLYCGISAETEEEDIRTWVLFQLDARKGQWASNRVMIPEMPHGDMGVGNCFEIFDKHLYGASSRMPVNSDSYESQGWNSFYYVFRFPLGHAEKVEVMEKKASWRRWPADGNVDDRWGFLQLVKEEESGEIYLYESRREFLESRPQSQRNCYRKKVVFPAYQPDEPRSWVSRESQVGDNKNYRDDFHPNDVHHGDDWYRDTTYKVREAPIRTYIPSCRTYLDVIAQPQDSTADKPLLHIRTRPKAPCRRCPTSATTDGNLGMKFLEQETKADHGVYIWPSETASSGQDEQLGHFLDRLYPDTTAQEVSWYADARFIVYPVGNIPGKTSKHIVVISFDPSVRLPGVKGRHSPGSKAQMDNCKTNDGVGGLPPSGESAGSSASSGSYDTPQSFGLDLSGHN